MKDKGKYYHADIETGFVFEVSKEFHDTMKQLWERYKPKENPVAEKVIITSTTKGKFDESLFYNSEGTSDSFRKYFIKANQIEDETINFSPIKDDDEKE